MAIETPKIDFSSIDFEELKTELKEFITVQEEFSDHNQEGANLNLMVSLLAYVTTLLSFNLNQGLNETFLPTVELRENILKIIKLLNYTPRRTRSSKIRVDLTNIITSGGPPSNLLTFDKIKSSEFNFFYVGDLLEVTGDLINVEFEEGTLVVNESFFTAEGVEFESFIIEDAGIGEFLSIFSNGDGPRTKWELHEKGRFYIDPENTRLFFTEEVENGIKISTGNGKFGKKPNPGEVFGFDYIRPDITGDADNLTDFTFDGGGITESINNGYSNGIIDSADVSLNADNVSSQGSNDKETLEEIKFNAPRFSQSQGRAVIENDYFGLIINKSEIAKAQVVGGQKLNPRQLGKVIVTVKPNLAVHPNINFTDQELLDFKNFLLEKSVVTIEPILQNAQFIHLTLISVLRHTSIARIPSIEGTKNVIDDFVNIDNSDFGEYLEFSNLVSIIDSADELTTSNLTSIEKYITLDETNIKNETEDGEYTILLSRNIDITFTTRIEIFENDTGNTVTTLTEGIDYNVIYQSAINGTAEITFINTGETLSLTETGGNGGKEIRFFFDTEDNDVFLNTGQIFNINKDNMTVTTEAVL